MLAFLCRLGKILEIEEVVEALMEGILTNKKMVFVPPQQSVGLLIERYVKKKKQHQNFSSKHPSPCIEYNLLSVPPLNMQHQNA